MKYFLLFIGLIFSGQAFAGCTKNYDSALEQFNRKFGEKPVITAVPDQKEGQPPLIMEILVNRKTKSYTVIMIGPEGKACVVSSGRHFSITEEKTPQY